MTILNKVGKKIYNWTWSLELCLRKSLAMINFIYTCICIYVLFMCVCVCRGICRDLEIPWYVYIYNLHFYIWFIYVFECSLTCNCCIFTHDDIESSPLLTGCGRINYLEVATWKCLTTGIIFGYWQGFGLRKIHESK